MIHKRWNLHGNAQLNNEEEEIEEIVQWVTDDE